MDHPVAMLLLVNVIPIKSHEKLEKYNENWRMNGIIVAFVGSERFREVLRGSERFREVPRG